VTRVWIAQTCLILSNTLWRHSGAGRTYLWHDLLATPDETLEITSSFPFWSILGCRSSGVPIAKIMREEIPSRCRLGIASVDRSRSDFSDIPYL
jgi:hypothetical protein